MHTHTPTSWVNGPTRGLPQSPQGSSSAVDFLPHANLMLKMCVWGGGVCVLHTCGGCVDVGRSPGFISLLRVVAAADTVRIKSRAGLRSNLGWLLLRHQNSTLKRSAYRPGDVSRPGEPPVYPTSLPRDKAENGEAPMPNRRKPHDSPPAWSTARAGPLHLKMPSVNSSNVTCAGGAIS